jgi:hypothetical protein
MEDQEESMNDSDDEKLQFVGTISFHLTGEEITFIRSLTKRQFLQIESDFHTYLEHVMREIQKEEK